MGEIKRTTSERLERFKPAEKYLERVRDESQGEFRSIRELLDRFTYFSTTRTGLVEREQHARNLVGRRNKQINDMIVVCCHHIANGWIEAGMDILKLMPVSRLNRTRPCC